VTRACAFFPGAGVDGVVLPFLAAAYQEHDQAEDEHEGSPSEVEIDAHRTLVDARSAGDEAEDAHDSARDEEDEAEGDADIESHVAPLGEDEIENDQHGQYGYGQGRGLLVPAQMML